MDTSDDLDLARALSVLRRRWRFVIGVPAAIIALVLVISLLQPKQYQASAVLLAGQGEGFAELSTINAVGLAAQSLREMVTDRVVVERAAREADIDAPIEDLLANVTAEVAPNTQQIELTVTDTDPERARDLANGIAETFSDLVRDRISADSGISVSLWQEASTPTGPSSPNIPLNLLIAAMVGTLLGIGSAFLREHLDARWRSEADVERYLGIPVLVSIPVFPGPGHGAKQRLGA